MTVRTKKYELKVGQTRQIKIIDNTAPIKVQAESDINNFVFTHILGGVIVSGPAPTVGAGGVILPPDGCWGSELRIQCQTSDDTLHVAYMG